MNKEEKNIYIETIDRKNKEIDEYRTRLLNINAIDLGMYLRYNPLEDVEYD